MVVLSSRVGQLGIHDKEDELGRVSLHGLPAEVSSLPSVQGTASVLVLPGPSSRSRGWSPGPGPAVGLGLQPPSFLVC